MVITTDLGVVKGDGYTRPFTAEHGRDFSLFIDDLKYEAKLLLEVSLDGKKWFPYELAFEAKKEGLYGIEVPVCEHARFKVVNDNRGLISMKFLQHR